MRSVLAIASVGLVLFNIGHAMAGTSEPSPAATVHVASAVVATDSPSPQTQPIHAPRPAANLFASLFETLGPRTDLVNCQLRLRRALEDCGTDQPCRAAARDHADVCDAIGYWRAA